MVRLSTFVLGMICLSLGDLFRLFLSAEVYAEYAAQYLQEFQIEEIDTAQYL